MKTIEENTRNKDNPKN